MSENGSPPDAFGRRKPPVARGLGRAPDAFRKDEQRSKDPFRPKAKTETKVVAKGDAFAQPAKPDLFAPKAKAGSKLPATRNATQQSSVGSRTDPFAKAEKAAEPKRDGFGKVKPPKPPKPEKRKPAAFSPPMAMKRAPASAARLPAPPKAPPAPKLDMFGRPISLSKTKPPPAMALGKPTKPAPALTKASGAIYNPFARKPAAPAPVQVKPAAPKQAVAPPPPKADPDTPPEADAPQAAADGAAEAVTAEVARVDSLRTHLQVVANDVGEDATTARPALKKVRRAPRPTSFVLVSGLGAGASASAETVDIDPGHEIATLTAGGDPDDLVADKPPEPPPGGDGPSQPPQQPSASVAESAGKQVEPPPAPPPEPPPAEKQVETVEATVEPPPQPKGPDPIGVADAPPPLQKPEAVETAWQAVEDGTGATARPAVGVLEKVEPAAAGGFWGGATIRSRAASRRRGLNQDDAFGLMFGLAVLAFLFLWMFPRRGETPGEGEIVTAQAAPAQSIAPATPLLAPPPPDPFGDKPVDLRPTGPTQDTGPVESATPPAATPAPPPAAPAQAVTHPPAATAAAPSIAEAALPLAGRKMHAWFCTASSRLTAQSRTALQGELDKFSGVFKDHELIVRGYADTRGSSAYNASLGERRANSVAKMLKGKGLSVVDVQGVGELDGLDDNQDCANQRRVDVWVKGGPAETPSRECAPEPDAAALTCN